jgi:hypothetical protein
MKSYHYFFYVLKIIILIAILLTRVGIIPIDGKYYIIIESIFKFSLGIFIIIYFSNKNLNVERHDRILFYISGVVLISMIDYDKFKKALREEYKITLF